jgi:hypothetical protein
MNKQMDVLYDEFVDSISPEAILSKLKKSELIELLMYAHEDLLNLFGRLYHDWIEEAGYESLEPKIDFVETEILKRMGEFKND